MFETRLKWFCVLLGLAGAAVAVRLAMIQIVYADELRAVAERSVTRGVRYSRAVRGSILDRAGRTLVWDAPSFDVGIHYGVLANRADYLRICVRALREAGRLDPELTTSEALAQVRIEVAQMWRRLAELTGAPVAEFVERGERIRRRVERIAAEVARRRGVSQPIREETEVFHAIAADLDPDLALTIRAELGWMPWCRVIPSSRRVAAAGIDPLVHVLGRVGAVSAEALESDPFRDDPLRRLMPDEVYGASGVERLAEAVLRGTRGMIVEDYDRRAIETVDARRGSDVRLTLDLELQRRTMELLAEGVRASAAPSGAAAVVIDAETRDVRVLASYPAYDYERYRAEYDALRRDLKNDPLLFRAVSGQYPPGSICKAITLVGGLSDGVITPQTTFDCRGALNDQNAFRCWIYNQYRLAHGPQAAEDAVKNSCNIYFYQIGERLGAERLCEWFRRFGLGAATGIGLVEERAGIVADADWLRERRGRAPRVADAWNFSIGQGEITTTPLQAANVVATIASGRWAPVRLVHSVGSASAPADADAGASVLRSPQERAPRADVPRAADFDEPALRTLRRGMWRVVNDGDGTARDARLEHEGYVLCGKTGSAQVSPHVVQRRYIFEWPDGRREAVLAGSRDDAQAAFEGAVPALIDSEITERYPDILPGERLPAHAWFIGYTQSADTPVGAAPRGRVYAIAVLIEFGGSGGRVAGPVAKRIAEMLLE